VAGLYYTQESQVKPVGAERGATLVQLRIYVEPGKIRIEYPKGGRLILAHLKEGVVWSVDERRGLYAEASFDAIVAKWKALRQAKGVGQADTGIAFTKRGTNDRTILGHRCLHHVITSGDGSVLDVWAAPDLDFPEKETLYEYRARMGEFSPAVLDEIKRIKGFPLMMNGTTFVGGEKMSALRTVTAVRQEDFAPDRFELPKGLKKIAVEGK